MSARFVDRWTGGMGGRLGGWAVEWMVPVVCGFGVGGFATCWNWSFKGIRWSEYFNAGDL